MQFIGQQLLDAPLDSRDVAGSIARAGPLPRSPAELGHPADTAHRHGAEPTRGRRLWNKLLAGLTMGDMDTTDATFDASGNAHGLNPDTLRRLARPSTRRTVPVPLRLLDSARIYASTPVNARDLVVVDLAWDALRRCPELRHPLDG